MQPLRLTCVTNGPDETMDLGRRLGRLLAAGDVVALVGDLGAGKTCLTRGIAQGLEVPASSCVRSPSFTILNIHTGKHDLYHLDLYRIRTSAELEDLGYREFFYGEGVTVIEWADKIKDLLPADHFRVSLEIRDESTRTITVEGKGSVAGRQRIALRSVLARFGGC